jgi:hypothetical protein
MAPENPTDPLGAGIHTITAEQYHNDPAPEPSLSASIANLLLSKSPAHAYIVHPQLGAQRLEDREERFDIGTATHSMFLQGKDIVHEVQVADWRTKDAQDVRKKARANGLIPLLSYQYKQVLEMNACVREQLLTHDANPPLFTAGQPEQTIVWQEDGVWCRARLDWLRDDFTAIDDLKTTAKSANPHEWTRNTMWTIGADVQYAMYIRAVKAITGVTPEFRYAVAENQPPFAVSVVSLSPEALALANEKVDRALAIWKACLSTGVWPAYPKQTVYAELPPWTEARWMERRALEEMTEEMAA